MNIRVFDYSNFGEFIPFLDNPDITDIVWDGRALWVDDINKGRVKTDVILNDAFVRTFPQRVSIYAGRAFNSCNPLLEAQIGLFRVSVVNEEFAHTGTSIAIRRTSDSCRLIKEECLENGFCDEETWNLLAKIPRANISCISGGLPGVGKTEVLKLLSTWIAPDQRAIVMEDSPEFHYAMINPESDCTEWMIDDTFTYEMALKASLRQRPDWNILAEVRGTETRYLMENFSTGINVLTSMHLDNESDLISRIENMIGEPLLAARARNEIYMRGLAVIVIAKAMTEGGIKRKLAQLSFYTNENGVQTRTLVVKDGKVITKELPPSIVKKFATAGYDDPFEIIT